MERKRYLQSGGLRPSQSYILRCMLLSIL